MNNALRGGTINSLFVYAARLPFLLTHSCFSHIILSFPGRSKMHFMALDRGQNARKHGKN